MTELNILVQKIIFWAKIDTFYQTLMFLKGFYRIALQVPKANGITFEFSSSSSQQSRRTIER